MTPIPSSDVPIIAAVSTQADSRTGHFTHRGVLLLFLASCLTLYFELVIIRYLATEIRIFAYLKNLALIASFFGIGLGMILRKPSGALKRRFPLVAAVLLMMIKFAPTLRLSHLPFPNGDYQVWGYLPSPRQGPWFALWVILLLLVYLGVVLGIMRLVVEFFKVLGAIVGERLSLLPPLPGYAVNLAGSLTGILLFTMLCFWSSPPAIWVGLGLALTVPFFIPNRWAIAVFALITCFMFFPEGRTYWSPYYRITLEEQPTPRGWSSPAAYLLDVNHDYHQKMLNLSPQFVARFPNAEPNRSGLGTYELPYRLVPHPGQVLVVGAGTGNDVAAALRHGAAHVDAVEIDPTILKLGRTYHPERPYDSTLVTVHVDDARAFFKKTRQTYDLIVFGYLDSHTLLTSMSSVRLDNYVYTLESFREAKRLLREGGTVVLAFDSGRTFLSDRLFATLASAFGTPPRAYFTGYDTSGVVFVEGRAKESSTPLEFPEITKELAGRQANTLLATDHWPFLYIKSRTIPFAILSVLVVFLCLAVALVARECSLTPFSDPGSLHLFFLGAGFMLLETKAVTELSLLFGSTWVVNAVVIAAFLLMGLLANLLVMVRRVSRAPAYGALFLLLVLGTVFPYSSLDALPGIGKVVAAAVLVGLPVFFSGMVFSRSFADVASPAQGLGINLLGAVVGGSLENLVMIGGTPILGVLAVALYGLSVVFLWKPGREKSLAVEM